MALAVVTSRLFNYNALDEDDPLDKQMAKQAQELQAKLGNMTETERNNLLQSLASQGNERYNELQLALAYVILTEPAQAPTFVRYMSYVVRDSYAFVSGKVKYFLSAKFAQLLRPARDQLVWLIGALVERDAVEGDVLMMAALRQIKGGDISADNIALTQGLLDVLTRNRVWLEKNALLVATVWYTFTRLITDHNTPALQELRTAEIDLSVRLLTTKFNECCMIGRDMVRLLQEVSRLPQYRPVWEQLLGNPSALSPGFAGIHQLLLVPTPKRFLQSRLTPAMEEQLMFIMENVRMGNQKRYQDWFLQEFLTTNESETLLTDLVRFICVVYHPSNTVLASDRVQRWAVIGWLLKCVKTNFCAANVKLCLFYDWLFFNTPADSIMNIEPAILVMQYSLPKYKNITTTLLDFLIVIRTTFHPPMADAVCFHVNKAVETLLSLRVVSSIEPIFMSEHVEPDLRDRVREAFGQFMPSFQHAPPSTPVMQSASPPFATPPNSGPSTPTSSSDTEMDTAPSSHTSDKRQPALPSSLPSSIALPPPQTPPAPAAAAVPTPEVKLFKFEPISKSMTLSTALTQALGPHLQAVQNEVNDASASRQALPQLIDRYLDTAGSAAFLMAMSAADELAIELARFLLAWYPADFQWSQSAGDSPLLRLLAQRMHSMAIVVSAGAGVGAVKRPGVATANQVTPGTRRARLIRILAALRSQGSDSATVGPVMLMATLRHLESVTSPSERRATAVFFEEVLAVRAETHRPLERTSSSGASQPSDDLSRARRAMEKDLLWLDENHLEVFHSVLPTCYQLFGNLLRSNTVVLRAALSTMDFAQMLSYTCAIQARHWLIFGSAAAAMAMAEESIGWETFEQMCMWHLMAAELDQAQIDQFALAFIMSSHTAQLNLEEHAETFNGMQILLRQAKPTQVLVLLTLTLTQKLQTFAIGCLRKWERSNPVLLGKVATATIKAITAQLSGATKPQEDVEDDFIGGQGQAQSMKDVLQTNTKQKALHAWRVIKELSNGVGGDDDEAHKPVLTKNAAFCVACRDMMHVLRMEADFNFSNLASEAVDEAPKSSSNSRDADEGDKRKPAASATVKAKTAAASVGSTLKQSSTQSPATAQTKPKDLDRLVSSAKPAATKSPPPAASQRPKQPPRRPATKSSPSSSDSGGSDSSPSDVDNDDREFKPKESRRRGKTDKPASAAATAADEPAQRGEQRRTRLARTARAKAVRGNDDSGSGDDDGNDIEEVEESDDNDDDEVEGMAIDESKNDDAGSDDDDYDDRVGDRDDVHSRRRKRLAAGSSSKDATPPAKRSRPSSASSTSAASPSPSAQRKRKAKTVDSDSD